MSNEETKNNRSSDRNRDLNHGSRPKDASTVRRHAERSHEAAMLDDSADTALVNDWLMEPDGALTQTEFATRVAESHHLSAQPVETFERELNSFIQSAQSPPIDVSVERESECSQLDKLIRLIDRSRESMELPVPQFPGANSTSAPDPQQAITAEMPAYSELSAAVRELPSPVGGEAPAQNSDPGDLATPKELGVPRTPVTDKPAPVKQSRATAPDPQQAITTEMPAFKELAAAVRELPSLLRESQAQCSAAGELATPTEIRNPRTPVVEKTTPAKESREITTSKSVPTPNMEKTPSEERKEPTSSSRVPKRMDNMPVREPNTSSKATGGSSPNRTEETNQPSSPGAPASPSVPQPYAQPYAAPPSSTFQYDNDQRFSQWAYLSTEQEEDITADFSTTGNLDGTTEQTGDNNEMLIGVASSPNSSEQTLKWLSTHANPDIRKAVASNPKTAMKVLCSLAKDWTSEVRAGLLDNPELPIDLIAKLVGDTNPIVSLKACTILDKRKAEVQMHRNEPAKTPSRTIKDLPHLQPYQTYLNGHRGGPPISSTETKDAIEFLQMIARKWNTPSQRLEELSKHPAAEVRCAVASNMKSPVDLLWQLSVDSSTAVRLGLTKNESCPVELLIALSKDQEMIVQHSALKVLGNIEFES